MTGKHPGGDTKTASWGKTKKRLKLNAEELRAHGFEVKEPADFETPPHRRIADTVTGV